MYFVYTFLGLIFFMLGASVGSFINMAEYRLHNKLGFFGRSFCDTCKKPLNIKELVPVFSYFYYKGRCSCNKSALNKSMLFVELTLGLLFVVVFILFILVQHGDSFIYLNFYQYNSLHALFYWLTIVSCLVFIFIYDYKYFEIPYSPVFIMFLSWLLFNVTSFVSYSNALMLSINNSVLGKYLLQTDYVYNNVSYYSQNIMLTLYFAVGVFVFFLFLFLVTKGRGMGFGDVYTAPVLSLIVGFPLGIAFMILSFVIGAAYGVTALALKKAKLKTAVPFAPFMIVSLFITLTFAPLITKLIL